MSTYRFFTINEFAKAARTTKDALRHYDKMGVLSPKVRGENSYRYYAREQLSYINMIRTLQKLGMTLVEIKSLLGSRTPEKTMAVLKFYEEFVNMRRKELLNAKNLLLTMQEVIGSVEGVDEKEISVRWLEEKAIVLGDENDYGGGRDDYDAWYDFYHILSAKNKTLNLSYPTWSFITGERIKKGDWKWPERYYFYNPKGRDRRRAGWYAIGYTRGKYGQTDGLYRRMMRYIEKNGWEIDGDAYEEYPLNELSIVDENNYLIRVMIGVREKLVKPVQS